MKPNLILIVGSIITIVLTLLWYFEVIGEPMVALGGAVLTFVGYIVSGKTNTRNNNIKKVSSTLNQTHSGSGDNVGGDKIVKN